MDRVGPKHVFAEKQFKLLTLQFVNQNNLFIFVLKIIKQYKLGIRPNLKEAFIFCLIICSSKDGNTLTCFFDHFLSPDYKKFKLIIIKDHSGPT